MFCANCGSQLPDDVKFCTNCGASLASAHAAQPESQPTAANQASAPDSAPVRPAPNARAAQHAGWCRTAQIVASLACAALFFMPWVTVGFDTLSMGVSPSQLATGIEFFGIPIVKEPALYALLVLPLVSAVGAVLLKPTARAWVGVIALGIIIKVASDSMSVLMSAFQLFRPTPALWMYAACLLIGVLAAVLTPSTKKVFG